MKILVLSDSHSALRFMRLCLDSIRPDAVIHLGDYVGDGEAIAEEYPQIPFYQVAGNCDYYRVSDDYPRTRIIILGGCKIYFTHGHLQKVKAYLSGLIAEARQCGADIALFGHTHTALFQQEDGGMWLLNPGSCGYDGGSAGLIELADRQILSCKVLREVDLENAL